MTAITEYLASVQVILLQNLFWWAVMTTSLAILLYFFVVTSLADVTIKDRSQWGAAQPKQTPTRIPDPVSWVVIHHSDGNHCSGTSCQDVVRNIQQYHMDGRQWADIGYNFLVAPSGEVYEGRGWGVVGAHALGYNSKSVGICLMGSYQDTAPPAIQVSAAQELVSKGVREGHISSSYRLVGHRQVRATSCPGDKLYNIIQQWPGYTNKLD